MNNEAIQMVSVHNYFSKRPYISGRIVEYDIKSANITMLRKYGKISDEYYNYLSRLPKLDREKEIGLLIRQDKSYFDTIQFGILEAKKQLAIQNNIQPESIVRVANDAVYINTPYNLQYTKFNDVEFKEKSISNVYVKIGTNILIFVSFIGDDIDIDIKGISKSHQTLHQNHMVSFIGNLIYMIERVSPVDALKMITDFYNNYVNLRLPVEYYREFNGESFYKIKGSNFHISNPTSLDQIDIGCNLLVLRELWSVVLSLCNLRKGQ